MEVTKKNFKEVLSQLKKVFDKAQFITFDTEFTGLKVNGSHINYLDTLDEVYLKDKLNTDKYMVIQYGIAAFRYDVKNDKYLYQAFNFYVFPSSQSDRTFSCQGSSINFLSKHGFDFNKLFSEGISYLTEEETKTIINKLDEKYSKKLQNNASNESITIPTDHVNTIQDVTDRIDEFLESDSDASINIGKYNRFVRRLIYGATKDKYGGRVNVETNKDETMTVFREVSSEESQKRRNVKYNFEKQEVMDCVGFSNVIKLIIESGKLLIGHNMFMDLLYTVKQFLHPLPDDYTKFKQLVQHMFTKLIDTKYMASVAEFRISNDTSLPNLVQHLSSSELIPEVVTEPGCDGYTLGTDKLHEAGYDAYLTGLCFLGMVKNLGNMNLTNVYKTLPQSPLLKDVMNKLSVMRLQDIPCINIGGRDVTPSRKNVFYLTFPKDWTREDIYKLFKGQGFINVAWVSDTEALVSVSAEHVASVKLELLTKKNVRYHLGTYKDYKQRVSDKCRDCSQEQAEQIVDNKRSTPVDNVEDVGDVVARPHKKICFCT